MIETSIMFHIRFQTEKISGEASSADDSSFYGIIPAYQILLRAAGSVNAQNYIKALCNIAITELVKGNNSDGQDILSACLNAVSKLEIANIILRLMCIGDGKDAEGMKYLDAYIDSAPGMTKSAYYGSKNEERISSLYDESTVKSS